MDFISGLLLGFVAGVAPGPLLALVVSQTLTYGVTEGVKVAVAPLMTDVPIVLAALLIGNALASQPFPLGLLSLAGAGYISYLAWESFRIRLDDSPTDRVAKSLTKGILANFLNPHPYLFWMTVGTPLLLKTWENGPGGAIFWLFGFYLMLVGSKMGIALLTGYSRQFLYGRGYLWLNRCLGLILLFFAVVLLKDGMFLIMDGLSQG
jgi:threonine/homoserine/homoserine lactone efflux protein